MSEVCTPSLTLYFNGAPLICPPDFTLQALLDRHGIAAQAVATAVNGCFVARDQRASTPLQAGDQVLTFQAIVGG